ncbi:MAG TPA: long-chain fatty acid--CoA ligase [Desulfotomaculum sp.]|nr:MAG: AMP-dependent synthetase [Desulfotomaculum sp. BICA1-6]HBX22172.1 long-chain fatty acid--CoA ligase [Desulfotomaculum sp.]
MSIAPTWKLPFVNSYIEKWAVEAPDRAAIIQHEDGRVVTYSQFNSMIDFCALKLLEMGINKGDRVATMLLLFPEHLALMYACFKVGAIVAPLDLRLKEAEVTRDLDKIKPKAFFFHGQLPVRDFREVGRAVQQNCPYVEHLLQVSPAAQPGDILQGAANFADQFSMAKLMELKQNNQLTDLLSQTYSGLDTRTAALIIFTTGTTGEPKPAVLCHENIVVQNEVLARGIGLQGAEMKLVCNMPCSHVAGTSEGPMTTFYAGGTAVILRIFDPRATLDAVQKWQATVLGMIPTQFRMLWGLPNYNDYDLSSLKFALYAGASVDVQFLRELAKMAPQFGTGLGMTENAGFATFTPPGISVDEMAGQVGTFFADVAQVTVRKPMNDDGTAGEEQPDGEVGEICYHPPIVFLGYYDQPEETAKAVSREGILYTGDMGYFKTLDAYRALYLAGRRKFIIKQKGYNVFPDEVAAHIGGHPNVALADVVGAPHRLFDEGIIAFVQPKPGTTITEEEIMTHCRDIASYKRPQHVVLWPEDKPWPLSRTGKVDKVVLMELANSIIEELRSQGRWDT